MLTSLATFGLALSSLVGTTIARPQVLQPRQQSYAGQINGTRVSSAPVALDVSINGGGRNATAPLLYGWMFEDINARACVAYIGKTPLTFHSTLEMAGYMQRWLPTEPSKAQYLVSTAPSDPTR